MRTASLSLDVDNLWSYMKIHGDPRWESRPSYLDVFIPYVTELLQRLGVKITFFIVGVDAADSRNHPALCSITAAGHEVGNHSFEHEPWLHLYTRAQLETEIDSADAAITQATGQRPVGFRGPGFSWCRQLLEVLAARGHGFDASTLPTYLGPLARAYYFATAKLTPEERVKRKELFGRFTDGLRPVKPYYWDLGAAGRLLEIPVTTMPLIKAPFHFSYLAFLAGYSETLMMAYLKTALAACRATGTEPSFLLHPLDVIGADQVEELAFFPAMTMTGKRKAELLVRVIEEMQRHYQIVPMGEHARRITARDDLPVRQAA